MRTQLTRGEGIVSHLKVLEGFALLPVGARDNPKAPVNIDDGSLLRDWGNMRYPIEKIAEWYPTSCQAVGVICGLKNLVIIDIDGRTGLDFAHEHDCHPFEQETGWADTSLGWLIARPNSTDRIKAAFLLSDEQAAILGPHSYGVITKPGAKGTREEVAVLWHGRQAVVLGKHPSGVDYSWCDTSPEQIRPIPPKWWNLVLAVKEKSPTRNPRSTPSIRTEATSHGGMRWHNPEVCGACGRPGKGLKGGDCRCARRSDGRLELHCSHGQTFSPPTGMKPGDVITGHDGEQWAYVAERPHGLGDGRLVSVFVIHQPKVMQTPVRSINSAVPALHIAEASEEKGMTLSQFLPPDITNALREVTKHLPYDEHVVGMSYLAGISGLVKLGTLICGNQITSYNVPPNLYIATVGRSGQKKTPLHQLTIRKPAINLLSQVADINRELYEEWIAACKDAKEDGRDKPKPPPRVSIHVSDYTGEALNALLSVLEGKKRGLLLTRDEISGLLCSMNSYRKGLGADAQQLLEIYDGHASNAIRISGDRSYERCHVSIQGNIQPEVLRDLVKTGDPDGRWARFMFLPMREMTCPLPTQVNEETIDAVRSAETVLQTYASRVFHLEPATYELDQSAIEAFCRYEHQAQLDVQEAPSSAHCALLGKKAGKALRVAGLLHILQVVSPDIPSPPRIALSTLNTAIEMVEFLDSWTLSFQGVIEDEIQGGITPLMRRIHHIAGKSKIAVPWKVIREQMSGSEKKAVTVEAAKRAMDELAKQGLGTVTKGARGGLAFKAEGTLP